MEQYKYKATILLKIMFINRVSIGGNAIAPSVRFHSIFRTYWPLTVTFCTCMESWP